MDDTNLGNPETFSISYDHASGAARIALVGSAGSEILILMPFEEGRGAAEAEILERILSEGEARLRAAVLSMMAHSWPKDPE